jgi:hypothetical protein
VPGIQGQETYVIGRIDEDFFEEAGQASSGVCFGRYHADRQPGIGLQSTVMCPAGLPARSCAARADGPRRLRAGLGPAACKQSAIKTASNCLKKGKALLTIPPISSISGSVGSAAARALRPDDMAGTGPQCGGAKGGPAMAFAHGGACGRRLLSRTGTHKSSERGMS